ncbi:hypothetical protein AB0G77_40830 [Streptomyces hygroscopicus]|uniref:hypothetical protein n=1 Tax=Streptomyces hygroscopicus TaxID=1912 RepID=UPI003406A998
MHKYHIGTWSQKEDEKGMTVSLHREISQPEYESYGKAIAKFKRLEERRTFLFLERSSNELKSIMSTYVNIENIGGSFRKINWQQAGSFLMERFVTWLAATRLYLESERDFMLRRFGPTSTQMASYKEATSVAFDAHEGYRFLYNLRDYTQHCGIPSSGVTVSRSPEDKRKVRLYLNRVELLSARFSWNKHSKSLLQTWPEKVDVIPLVDDAMTGYRAIERNTLRILIEDSAAAIEEIRRADYSAAQSGTNLAAFQIPTGEGGGNLSFHSFPSLQALSVIESAVTSDDPVSLVFSESIPRPIATPEIRQANRRAEAVLSAFINPQEPDQVAKVINEIIENDNDIGPLISGLVNTSAQLTYALSMFLGVAPISLLGGVSEDQEEVD